jgi:hypothetical protein
MKEIQNDTPAIHQQEASDAEKIAASSQFSGTDAGSERAGDRGAMATSTSSARKIAGIGVPSLTETICRAGRGMVD